VTRSATDGPTLDIEGRTVPLRIRRDRRARRLILRIDGHRDGVVVTLPGHVPVAEGVDLARSKAAWIMRQLDRLPPRVPFAHGALVPVLGVDHRVRFDPAGRRPVRRGRGEIVVGGRPEHLARRLTDWLRAEARRLVAPRAHHKAERLGRAPAGITMRDTRSRWGSCSADGKLSFSWRLVMAPEHVLDYVVAHEVAHLVEKNHGSRFWELVADLTGDAETARAWLNAHGARLHRYG
jgi:predicted metal-dependent hydrolase